MKIFDTIQKAKDFLATRIADEAVRENVPLSETERKMLYFSETDWTLPDMAKVSEEFDRDYDQDDFERKIAGLVSKIAARHHENIQEEESWNAAVEKLAKGDNYLTVLIQSSYPGAPAGNGFLPTLSEPAVRPSHDRLKLWATAFAIVFGILGAMALGNWLLGPKFWNLANRIFGGGNFKLFVGVAALVWVVVQVFGPKLSDIFRLLSSRR